MCDLPCSECLAHASHELYIRILLDHGLTIAMADTYVYKPKVIDRSGRMNVDFIRACTVQINKTFYDSFCISMCLHDAAKAVVIDEIENAWKHTKK